MILALDILSWILLGTGTIFLLIGSVGLIRLPDFFTRMHAAGRGRLVTESRQARHDCVVFAFYQPNIHSRARTRSLGARPQAVAKCERR